MSKRGVESRPLDPAENYLRGLCKRNFFSTLQPHSDTKSFDRLLDRPLTASIAVSITKHQLPGEFSRRTCAAAPRRPHSGSGTEHADTAAAVKHERSTGLSS